MATLGTGSSPTFHSEIADDSEVDAPDRLGPVSAVPIVAAGTDAATAELVSVVDWITTSAACGRLAEDTAQTTLMVVEFERWYREQRDANYSILANDCSPHVDLT